MVLEVIFLSSVDSKGSETLDASALRESSSFSHVGNRYERLDLMLCLDRDICSDLELGHYWERGTKESSGGSGF